MNTRQRIIKDHGRCSCWICSAARIYQRVWEQSDFAGRAILDQVWDAMIDGSERRTERLTPEIIERQVCAEYGVSRRQMRARSQRPRMVGIRRVLARRLKDELGLSTVEIGSRLNREHSTILHLLAKGKADDGRSDRVA